MKDIRMLYRILFNSKLLNLPLHSIKRDYRNNIESRGYIYKLIALNTLIYLYWAYCVHLNLMLRNDMLFVYLLTL